MTTKVEGAQQLTELAAKLKRLERGDLRRELLKSIRTAAKPLGEEARKSAAETLPKSGGLAAEIAATPVRVRSSLSGRSARVRLSDPTPHRTRALDRGRLRHPVFGNRDNWVSQQIPPGWWTKPMEEGAPHVREAIVRTIREISEKLV